MPGSFDRVVNRETIQAGHINELQESLENIVYTSVPSGGTSTDELVVVAGNPTWRTRPEFDARDFGATGDGVTDDAAAFQAAIDAAAPVCGVVVVPSSASPYRIESTLTIPSGVTIRGSGRRKSRIYCSVTNVHAVTISGTQDPDTLAITPVVQVSLVDLALIGPGKTAGGTGCGLWAKWLAVGCNLTRVYIVAWGSHGTHWEDSYTAIFDGVEWDGNGGDGFHGLTNCNALDFRGCLAINNGGAGVQIIGGAGNRINVGCESNAAHGLDLRYVFGTTVSGNYERNGRHATTELTVPGKANINLHYRTSISEKCNGVVVTAANLAGHSVTETGILVDGANLCEIGPAVTVGTHTIQDIKITADASRNLIGTVSSNGAAPTITDASTSTVYERYLPAALALEIGPAVLVRPTTTNPPQLGEGLVWYRSDTDQLRLHDGARVRTLFSGVEAAVAADPPSIAANSSGTFTVTVTGAATGDRVLVTPPSDLNANLVLAAWWVSAADTVTIRLHNFSAGAIDQGSGTWRVIVVKA